MKRFSVLCVLSLTLAILFAFPALAQMQSDFEKKVTETAAPAEEAVPAQAEAPAEPTPAEPAPVEPAVAPIAGEATAPVVEGMPSQEIAIYGEILSMNTEAKSMAVQYYDYDSDEEKTAELMLDDKTKLENAVSLTEMKKGDWVDATYETKDGNNIAKSIILEKEELPAAETTEE